MSEQPFLPYGWPDPINTETEYQGRVPTSNTVSDLGPNERKLESHEQLRLSYLTGQQDDPNATRKQGFMGGVDPDHPANPDNMLPPDYYSDGYQ